MLRCFKDIPHEVLDILCFYPSCTDTHLYLTGIQFCRLHLRESLHIYVIFRVFFGINLRRFQLVTDIAA